MSSCTTEQQVKAVLRLSTWCWKKARSDKICPAVMKHCWDLWLVCGGLSPCIPREEKQIQGKVVRAGCNCDMGAANGSAFLLAHNCVFAQKQPEWPSPWPPSEREAYAFTGSSFTKLVKKSTSWSKGQTFSLGKILLSRCRLGQNICKISFTVCSKLMGSSFSCTIFWQLEDLRLKCLPLLHALVSPQVDMSKLLQQHIKTMEGFLKA